MQCAEHADLMSDEFRLHRKGFSWKTLKREDGGRMLPDCPLQKGPISNLTTNLPSTCCNRLFVWKVLRLISEKMQEVRELCL